MAEGNTLYPTALDGTTELPEPIGTEAMNLAGKLHGPFHKALSLAVRAIEAKVGITSSADSSSHDYKLANHQGNALWIGQPHSTQNAAVFTNEMRVIPVFVHARITVSKVRFRVVNSLGNVSAAIYNTSGTRLITTGAVACPATGNPAEVAFVTPTSVTLTPGRHFMAFSCDNNTAQFRLAGEYIVPGMATLAASHPCPASFTPSASSTAIAPPMLIALP